MSRRDHKPDPDHEPDRVFCLVCDEELKHVTEWKDGVPSLYWRHVRPRKKR